MHSPPAGDIRLVVARRDPSLSARVVRRVPMRYAAGADPALDRPPYVRAASGIAWVGSRLAVIQDDANFVALVDPLTGVADAIALPPGPGGKRLFDDGRGTKTDKLDHEALVSIPGEKHVLLVALGSGSLPRRESITLLIDPGTPGAATHVLGVPRFYARLRETPSFSGSELNVEGAVFEDGNLRLFGRGNGAVRGEMRPVNATCEVAWAALRAHLERQDAVEPPVPSRIVQYDLGAIDGAPLAFTDATTGWDGGDASRATLFLAAAEASPDVLRDGDVVGSVLGVIEANGRETTARWTVLADADGSRLHAKAEGIALAGSEHGRVFIAVDADAHDQASELLEVRLDGPWP